MCKEKPPTTVVAASHSHRPMSLDLRLTVHSHPIARTLWLWEVFSSSRLPVRAIITIINEAWPVPGNLRTLQ